MTRTPVESSQIKSIGFDPKTNTLEIEFQGGTIYQYQNVSADIHKALLAAKSAGRHFSAYIKPFPHTFPCTKLAEEKTP